MNTLPKSEVLKGFGFFFEAISPSLGGGSSESSSSGGIVLGTASSTVDGALWLDVSGDKPIPKYFYGGTVYTLGGISGTGGTSGDDTQSSGDDTQSGGGDTPSTPTYSEYLVAYLPFDVSETADVCGNEWTIKGDVTLDTMIKKFGASSLHCPSGAYLLGENIIDINADKWTFDCWAYYVYHSTGDDSGIFAGGTVNATGTQRYGVILADTWCGIANNGDGWQLDDYYSASLPTGQWMHFAIVKNGTTIAFYLNGQLFKNYTLTSRVRTASYFWLGSTPYGTRTDAYLDNVRFFKDVALWKQNFTPPTMSDYTLGSEATPSTLDYPEYLVAYLPFDSSATYDVCGKSWTAYGSPTIVDDANSVSGKALRLASGQYLTLDNKIAIGGQDFTIDSWVYVDSSTETWSRILEMPQTLSSDTNNLFFARYLADNTFAFSYNGSYTTCAGLWNQWFHFAIVYEYESRTLKHYLNGVLKMTKTSVTVSRVARNLLLGKSSWAADGAFVGSFSHFRICDGVALWAEDFTPPTADDYL